MAGDAVGVLIAGPGVGGLATSALLAQYGVRSLLVDRRRETLIYPKAHSHGAVDRTSGYGALLVRPDDFVGWRVDESPADPGSALRQALHAILAKG